MMAVGELSDEVKRAFAAPFPDERSELQPMSIGVDHGMTQLQSELGGARAHR